MLHFGFDSYIAKRYLISELLEVTELPLKSPHLLKAREITRFLRTLKN
jgi:hypothetical protein